MRSIWTGSISFGLINIPVKIFSAVQENSLDLDMLDSKDHSNIKFNRVNETIGKDVSSLPLSLSHFFHKLIVRHLNYVINLLSYVMVFRLKDWTFA